MIMQTNFLSSSCISTLALLIMLLWKNIMNIGEQMFIVHIPLWYIIQWTQIISKNLIVYYKIYVLITNKLELSKD
jgi:hypothetical protein